MFKFIPRSLTAQGFHLLILGVSAACASDNASDTTEQTATASPSNQIDSSQVNDESNSFSESEATETTQLESPPAILLAHNEVREAEGAGLSPMKWDQNLAVVAQGYADALAGQDCALIHSSGPYGENLYWSKGFKSSPQVVVDSWASEIEAYDYDTNACSGVCGHYTQIVWQKTERLGCGQASCAGGEEVWVCNYDPPGNWVGEKPY